MYTKCPNCDTIFEASRSDIRKAKGMVRCGECETIFDAPLEKVSFTEQRKTNNSQAHEIITQAKRLALQPIESTVWYMVVVVGLSLLLAAQLLYLNKKFLLTNETSRSIALSFCQIFSCQVQYQKNIEQLEIIAQEITLPESTASESYLQVTMRLINHARLPQPMPTIKISLGNLIGQKVATGIFEQSSYISSQTNTKTVIEPQEIRDVVFTFAKPSNRVNELTIELL
ncbi:MAG: zinc-ribbon and DUF3426 domain-containing protein [Methylacidiphilales bacterium]|nr:zinc-ribbon and DUF3426 domain-containing protein [Candidatus Methylacidiphilales bacterium]